LRRSTKMALIGLGTILLSLSIVGVRKLRHRGDRRGGQGDVASGNFGRSSVSGGTGRDYSSVASADNPGAHSVIEAVKTGKYPERLTPLIAPRPFDLVAFEANPQQYLDTVEPGRCFQTLKNPGPDSAYLHPASQSLVRAQADEPIALMVKGAPNAPVTFTAFEGGQFTENGLNSVSVRGDARGYATAHFKVPAGANGRLPVLAGSPMAVGNQTFLIDATPVPDSN
jgi:hypothetical protein